MLLVLPCYLLVTPGYLAVSSGFWLLNRYYWLLLVTSGYFSLLLVPRFSNNVTTSYKLIECHFTSRLKLVRK